MKFRTILCSLTLLVWSLVACFGCRANGSTIQPVSPHDELKTKLSSAAASNPASNIAGECINKSLGTKCEQSQPRSATLGQEQSKDQSDSDEPNLDNRAQLSQRLIERDQLMDNDPKFNQIFGSALSTNFSKEYDYEDQDSLRQVLLLHRHGDRTPISFSTEDPLKDEPFWVFHGFGQLTNRGKARVYLLGKIMRHRYDKFLRNSINKNQRISRASGSLRCIESAQMFLASFLGLDQENTEESRGLVWDQDKNNLLAHSWQPASVQSVPAKLDGMLAESAICNTLAKEYIDVIEPSPLAQSLYVKYKHEADTMNEVLGFKIDFFYKWFWGSSQLEVERSYFADKMNKKILDIYDKLEEAGNVALGIFQSTLNAKRLRSGLLMHDIVNNIRNFRNLVVRRNESIHSDHLKKFIHYSAHDLTIVLILGMLDQWEKFPYRPDYAANIVFELHQDSNEWFVRIFYMPEVPMKPIELHFARCEEGNAKNRCSLEKFEELMEVYVINSWQDWMKECNNDFSTLNPYVRGN